ncbi:hypothetical protein V6N11_082513 [Hibiscus sabdariffa]|uniref:Uncharacterized protein n=1 Tax=Hibiscus sabdariffa TaxID=183260 RepID=A0ABR2N8U8_9ROSI
MFICSTVLKFSISIEEQLQVLATLFARCTCNDGVKRPTMIEVAKELKNLIYSPLRFDNLSPLPPVFWNSSIWEYNFFRHSNRLSKA